jgi:plasmid stability protein
MKPPTITTLKLDDVHSRVCARAAEIGRSIQEADRLILSDAVGRNRVSRDAMSFVVVRCEPAASVDLELLTSAFAFIVRSHNMLVATRKTRAFEDFDIAVVDPLAAE